MPKNPHAGVRLYWRRTRPEIGDRQIKLPIGKMIARWGAAHSAPKALATSVNASSKKLVYLKYPSYRLSVLAVAVVVMEVMHPRNWMMMPGRTMSIVSVSREKRLMMRPEGVVS